MHAAAEGGHTSVIHILIDANAPGIDVSLEDGTLPLHMAASSGCEAAIRLLLVANPAAAFAQDNDGRLPLHRVVWWRRSEAAVRLLLAANPAAALVKDSDGRLPLHLALLYRGWPPYINEGAARALLPASGLSAAQGLDLLAAVPAQAQPLVQPLYADLAAHMPLTVRQWLRVPSSCRGLGSALPAVLARSEVEAALLLAHLSPADAERLRTAALSLHRVQRSLQLSVPAALVGRMLALALADD